MKQTTHYANRGFALLEVLVAVLIFSIGLLGLAGLQLTSLKFTRGAYQLTQFSETSYDMIDRMRANMPGVIAGDYLGTITAVPESAPDPDCIGTDDSCTAQQLALAEQYQWATELSTLFPGVWSATIACNDRDGTDPICERGSILTITISWQEQVDEQTDVTDNKVDGIVTRSFNTSFQAGRKPS